MRESKEYKMERVDVITFHNYFKKYKFKVFSSFTDVAGTSPLGYGRPAIDTKYGLDGFDEPILKTEMRKESRDDMEWKYKYYANKELIKQIEV